MIGQETDGDTSSIEYLSSRHGVILSDPTGPIQPYNLIILWDIHTDIASSE